MFPVTVKESKSVKKKKSWLAMENVIKNKGDLKYLAWISDWVDKKVNKKVGKKHAAW